MSALEEVVGTSGQLVRIVVSSSPEVSSSVAEVRSLRSVDAITVKSWLYSHKAVRVLQLLHQEVYLLERAHLLVENVYLPKKLSRKKDKGEESGWYYFGLWRSHKLFVLNCPSSIKHWKEGWFWVSKNCQRMVNDPELDLKVPSFYCIMTDFEQGKTPMPPLARLMASKVKELQPSSSEDSHQKKAI
ncbi:hypothetical protein Adt_39368 [Abeliophyllum distichum]|uniref:Uncharacterized protein n=1 Tax=Abeliophyllum distichum TaxID=126358 RepID=A0ABD1Q5Y7_9LAMI